MNEKCSTCLKWIAKPDRGTGRCTDTGGFRYEIGNIEKYCYRCDNDEDVVVDIDSITILTTHDFCCNRYHALVK